MATGRNRLTARAVQTAKGSSGLIDGGGLRLQISPAGTKSWIFRFMRRGRSREMGLGVYPTVTLETARSRAQEARALLAEDKDPIEERVAREQILRAETANAKTFDECANLCIAARTPGWRNAKHAEQWSNTLTTYASPHIGKMAVAQIETAHILRILEPIWASKTETASRVRGRIEAVLDWAKVMGHRTGENPARWRGHISELLPNRRKVARVEHHPALPYTEIGTFMAQLRKSNSATSKALELVVLTAARVSEVVSASPSEFDLEAKIWTIPATRMKSGRDHRVPLTDAAVTVIQSQLSRASDLHLFPGMASARPGQTVVSKKPLTSASLLKLLKDMGHPNITVHGFRSSFRDWVAERTAYPRELAEAALAHVLADKTEAAYQRGDMLEKRSRLMSDWANFCDSNGQPGRILPIRQVLTG